MTDDERAGFQRVIRDRTARLRQATRELVRLRHAAQRVVDLPMVASQDAGWDGTMAIMDAREHLRKVLHGA